MLRKFGPKTADDPVIGKLCPACDDPFKEGDFTTLIPIGPGKDPEQREKAMNGQAYNAVAIEVHYACATGNEHA
jgi:hypothetical protein